MHEGIILQVGRDGLGFVEEPTSKKRFAFTFDKIRGYRGESLRKLGIHAGARVRFSSVTPNPVNYAGGTTVTITGRPDHGASQPFLLGLQMKRLTN